MWTFRNSEHSHSFTSVGKVLALILSQLLFWKNTEKCVSNITDRSLIFVPMSHLQAFCVVAEESRPSSLPFTSFIAISLSRGWFPPSPDWSQMFLKERQSEVLLGQVPSHLVSDSDSWRLQLVPFVLVLLSEKWKDNGVYQVRWLTKLMCRPNSSFWETEKHWHIESGYEFSKKKNRTENLKLSSQSRVFDQKIWAYWNFVWVKSSQFFLKC